MVYLKKIVVLLLLFSTIPVSCSSCEKEQPSSGIKYIDVINKFSEIDLKLPSEADYIYLDSQYGLKNGWKYLRFECKEKVFEKFLEENRIVRNELHIKNINLQDNNINDPLWDLGSSNPYWFYENVIQGKAGEDDKWVLKIFRGLSDGKTYLILIQV